MTKNPVFFTLMNTVFSNSLFFWFRQIKTIGLQQYTFNFAVRCLINHSKTPLATKIKKLVLDRDMQFYAAGF